MKRGRGISCFLVAPSSCLLSASAAISLPIMPRSPRVLVVHIKNPDVARLGGQVAAGAQHGAVYDVDSAHVSRKNGWQVGRMRVVALVVHREHRTRFPLGTKPRGSIPAHGGSLLGRSLG